MTEILSAQRLTASDRQSNPKRPRRGLDEDVLNALRHLIGNQAGIACPRPPFTCAQRLTASDRQSIGYARRYGTSPPSAQRLTASDRQSSSQAHVSILYALCAQRLTASDRQSTDRIGRSLSRHRCAQRLTASDRQSSRSRTSAVRSIVSAQRLTASDRQSIIFRGISGPSYLVLNALRHLIGNQTLTVGCVAKISLCSTPYGI